MMAPERFREGSRAAVADMLGDYPARVAPGQKQLAGALHADLLKEARNDVPPISADAL